jgi:hypothetical protein
MAANSLFEPELTNKIVDTNHDCSTSAQDWKAHLLQSSRPITVYLITGDLLKVIPHPFRWQPRY